MNLSRTRDVSPRYFSLVSSSAYLVTPKFHFSHYNGLYNDFYDYIQKGYMRERQTANSLRVCLCRGEKSSRGISSMRAKLVHIRSGFMPMNGAKNVRSDIESILSPQWCTCIKTYPGPAHYHWLGLVNSTPRILAKSRMAYIPCEPPVCIGVHHYHRFISPMGRASGRVGRV